MDELVHTGLYMHRITLLKHTPNLDVTDTHTLLNRFSMSPVKYSNDLDSGAVTRTTCKSPVSRTSPAVSALVERECLWDAGKDQEAGDTHFRNKTLN